jgi:hypothetical protein
MLVAILFPIALTGGSLLGGILVLIHILESK